MVHDPRIVRDEAQIEVLGQTVPDWIRHMRRPPTPSLMPGFGPLEGIRAVGTGILVAQPYIGTKLAEFGAEVIHVERHGGDTFRVTAPFITRGGRPHGADEAEVAKNKLSLGLDLRHARGREVLMALWKISDVWMESSAPGTLERIGLTNELALAVNPRLVIVRISTYGQYGEPDYLARPGYDALAQAYGGMMSITGDPAGPPQRAKTYTGDYITALTGWAATMMGLWEVQKTGRGQVIDLAQDQAVAQPAQYASALYSRRHLWPHRTRTRSSLMTPFNAHAVSIVPSCAIYARVPPFLPHPKEYSFEACSKDAAAVNSPKGRELDRRLREYCAARPAAKVEAELNHAKIACSRVFGVREQYRDPHYAAREMTVPVLDRQSGVPIRVFGVVPKMSLTPGRIWRGAGSIGEDTTDILSTLLGLSTAEIDSLYAENTVHRTEPFVDPQADAANP